MDKDKAIFAPRGIARLESFRGRLRIRFPKNLFDGQARTVALNLPDLPKYRAIAEAKVEAINSDIALDRFDFTLGRYRPQSRQQAGLETKDVPPDLSLLELWDNYYEYGLLRWKESTKMYLQTSVRRWLEKAEASQIRCIEKALELRKFLLTSTSESMAKRVLTYVNAAYKLGLKQKLLDKENPYDGMANELKHNYQKSAMPLAFTPVEKLTILDNFANHKGNWNGRGLTGKGY
ncbi:MAG: DUF3596 domain-containing protein [Okeania sp. SIO3I5]|uniref:Arm DNA-binding domain-containing protein n=1 Tax=Okeania sp. SIO3I5 TaxID=2607805 RepID=UPI0013B73FDC|nr:DUF3596 domain-containing protein [Okeania sp. SIO3I5]NEQ37052.1 DUF3596 domain-containing protein [Okeania sp. SIO3I5]